MSLLAALPHPDPARLAVRVTPDAVRRLRAGHPWLFDRSIVSVSRPGAPGDLAVVFDERRRFVAIGLWDPTSPIRVRVLHAGEPDTVDAAWFERRITAAIERRRVLADSADPARTTGYRLVHGENDGLPGLVVDRYGPVTVIKVYSPAWLAHLSTVTPIVRRLAESRSVVLRLARNVARHRQALPGGVGDGVTLVGPEVLEPVAFVEAGVEFAADVVHGNKTGHFLDQRDNRLLLARSVAGLGVLDVFCATGGFSVHAAAGGARSVHSVDIGKWPVAATIANMARNAHRPTVAACEHSTTVGDAFAVMEELAARRTRYDVVVVDPPSFAPNASTVDRALTAYGRLTSLALRLVDDGGMLVQASCSARVTEADFVRTVHATAAREGFELDEIARTGHPLDHPIGFPEGAYLKAVFARPQRIRPTRNTAPPPGRRSAKHTPPQRSRSERS